MAVTYLYHAIENLWNPQWTSLLMRIFFRPAWCLLNALTLFIILHMLLLYMVAKADSMAAAIVLVVLLSLHVVVQFVFTYTKGEEWKATMDFRFCVIAHCILWLSSSAILRVMCDSYFCDSQIYWIVIPLLSVVGLVLAALIGPLIYAYTFIGVIFLLVRLEPQQPLLPLVVALSILNILAFVGSPRCITDRILSMMRTCQQRRRLRARRVEQPDAEIFSGEEEDIDKIDLLV